MTLIGLRRIFRMILTDYLHLFVLVSKTNCLIQDSMTITVQVCSHIYIIGLSVKSFNQVIKIIRRSFKAMELLTDRLAMLVEQVAENQMAELINKERLQQQRIMERSQREKMISFQQLAAANQARRTRKPIFAFKKKEEQKSEPKEEEQKTNDETPKVPKITAVCDIWGVSKKFKSKGGKAEESNEHTKADTPAKLNLSKFKKVAKMTVLMSSLKQGHEICTCENLDAKCKVHDT